MRERASEMFSVSNVTLPLNWSNPGWHRGVLFIWLGKLFDYVFDLSFRLPCFEFFSISLFHLFFFANWPLSGFEIRLCERERAPVIVAVSLWSQIECHSSWKLILELEMAFLESFMCAPPSLLFLLIEGFRECYRHEVGPRYLLFSFLRAIWIGLNFRIPTQPALKWRHFSFHHGCRLAHLACLPEPSSNPIPYHWVRAGSRHRLGSSKLLLGVVVHVCVGWPPAGYVTVRRLRGWSGERKWLCQPCHFLPPSLSHLTGVRSTCFVSGSFDQDGRYYPCVFSLMSSVKFC